MSHLGHRKNHKSSLERKKNSKLLKCENSTTCIEQPFFFYRAAFFIEVMVRWWDGGKLPVLGRPDNLDNDGAPTALAVGAGGVFRAFSLVCRFSLLSPSLWETAQCRLKHCLKGPLSPSQPTTLSL